MASVERIVAGRSEQVCDAALDAARSAAHVITLNRPDEPRHLAFRYD
jgi:hypothetical protein